MKEEIKKLWIDALRSGEYKQGKSVLCSKDNKYCCLGVLTDLYQKHSGTPLESRKRLDDESTEFFDSTLRWKNGVLPMDVVLWSGMPDSVGDGLEYEKLEFTSLWKLNDIIGLNFNQLADIIETQL